MIANTEFVEYGGGQEYEVSFEASRNNSRTLCIGEMMDAHPCDLEAVAAWAGIMIDLLHFIPCHVFNFDFVVCRQSDCVNLTGAHAHMYCYSQ